MFQSAETILNPQLNSGERLLWSGQPRGGIRLRGQDAMLIPFSLLWGGFAIFWECMALIATKKAPGPIGVVFPLFGLPFVGVGLYLIFGRFFVDAKVRARTFYGVTNERIIIINGFFSQQTKSLQLRTLTDVSLTQRPDGSGTISFGPAPFHGWFFPGRLLAWSGAL
jgi:Bacterial PH domain